MAENEQSSCALSGRIARFGQLDMVDLQKGSGLPQDIRDLLWSRELLPVIARADAKDGPFGRKAPIIGAGDISITYAVCPPGTGPSLHAHRRTYETFTVLRGRFEFSVGDRGEERAMMEELDVVSVPPGVHRAFKNIGSEEGVLQVVITGGVHDQKDVYFPASTAKLILEKGSEHLDHLVKSGLLFEEER